MRNKFFIKGLLCCAVLLARVLFLGVLVLVPAVSGFAMMVEEPRSFSLQDKSQEQIERKILPKIDIERLLAEDQARGKDPQGPVRIAVAGDVAFTLTNSGTWQTLEDGRLWRLRIQSPGAKHLSLGITGFELPEGAKLWIYDPGHAHVEGPFTARDRSTLGSLWTPMIEGDEIGVEVFVPGGVSVPAVEIGKVYQGYHGLGQASCNPPPAEGNCEIDVSCSDGAPWSNQILAVGRLTYPTKTVTFCCTGTLLNDTANVHKYFLTAYHCMYNLGIANKNIVYWNYQATTCNNGSTHALPPALSDHTQVKAWLAHTATTTATDGDFLLLELDQDPRKDQNYSVYFAGWDARGSTPPGANPAGTVVAGIHHPEGNVKALSFSNSQPTPTDWCSSGHTRENYWSVHWDKGGTEDGSSGSCLFDTQGRCIGQLYGGSSSSSGSCGAGTTCSGSYYSWYGKLSASWTGAQDASLQHWLDPMNTVTFNSGDPHINYADSTQYNFQGAGEYVALRNSDLEIQTRQTPLATTFNPGGLPDDGIATCVSLNTAVAARVGIHKVRYEPNFRGEPGLEIHVDREKPITLDQLGQEGRNLDGGRIAKTVDPTSGDESLEIDFPNHTRMIATPGDLGEGKYYLNLLVDHLPVMDAAEGAAPAAVGLMGPIPKGSWLPALPNGTAVPKPPSYAGLYQTFGDAWRVNEKTNPSLFDYARGTSTETFTLPICASTDSEKGSEKPCWPPEIPPNWPQEKPRCVLPEMKPVEPASEPVAQEACRQITGKNTHHDCIFDVRVTGNTGFAQTYLAQQQLLLGATETTVKGDKEITKYGGTVTFTATVAPAVSKGGAAPTGAVQFTLDGSNAGNPVTLDSNGQATWSTTSLQVDIHQVAANYTPSADSLYLASVSLYQRHVVLETFDWYLWLAILLLIIVLILLLWWYLH